MNEWTESTLEEEYEFTSGLSKSRDQFGFGYGFVSFKDVFYNFFLPTDLGELANTTVKEQESCSVKRGDVFLTRTSETFNELGMSSVALRDYDKATFNGFTKRLRPKQNSKIWPEYIGYYFRSSFFRSLVTSMATMTTRASLNNEILSKLKVKYPPLPEQKAIAHILGSLDDKIELNRQMNQTLESMAQALFKSWFVDFDPVMDNALQAGNDIPDELQAMAEKRSLVPNNQKLLSKNPELAALFPSSFVFNETLGKWIPEGWEVKKLQDLVSVKYGKDHKKLEEGDIPCYGSGGIMRYVEKALFETESVLIPRKGTLDNVMYVNKPFWSVDTMFYTEMKQNNFVKYFFNVMNKLNFSEMNEGSAVPSMTTAQLNAMDILHPSAQCLSEFDTLISKYFSKKEGNEIQIETLTQLRDRLLPELISGKVRVKEGMIESQ